MKLEDAVAPPRRNLTDFRGLGVLSLADFGSVARGEANERSDAGILFDRDRAASAAEPGP